MQLKAENKYLNGFTLVEVLIASAILAIRYQAKNVIDQDIFFETYDWMLGNF